MRKYTDQLTLRPSIDQLNTNYDIIPSADVYSFIYIDFLVKTDGEMNLPDILKNHSSIKSRNSEWLRFQYDYFAAF